MAQSQLSAHSLGEAGGAGYWEPTGGVGEQPIDIWSQLPATPVAPPRYIVTRAPHQTDIAHVLTAWRAAERQLSDHIEASPMRSMIQSEIARLRAEYQRLFAQASL